MSTTSLPESTSDAPPAPIRPPVLASDILLEDVAPHHPAASLLRLALGGVAAVFAALGVLELCGLLKAAGGWGELAVAAVAMVVMLFPLPYVVRATLAALTGFVPLLLGVMLLPETFAQRAAGLAMLVVLPAVFFFRARYRALSAARAVLAVAFVVAAPGLIFASVQAFDDHAPIAVRVLDGALVAGALGGAFGFMGAETTGACGVWATTTLGLASAHAASVVWTAGWRTATVAGVVCLVSATLLALAGFQLLATFFTEAARKVDVHRPVMSSSSPAD